MDDDIRTYELRFYGEVPEADLADEDRPKGGVFDTQKALIEHLERVDDSAFGPLAMADAQVTVYQGGDVDPLVGTNTIIGKIDGHVALITSRRKGGFDETDLNRPSI